MASPLSKIVDKTLDKIPVDKVYDDLASAGLKKAGTALADIIDIVTTPLLALVHARKKFALYLNDNLKRYEETLQEREEEPIAVPAELGVPILQKLTYTSKGDLADAFIRLLANASFEDSVHQVHPAFITTLSDLSRDEAIILKSLKPEKAIPVLSVDINYMEKDEPLAYAFSKTVYPMLVGFERQLDLHFPKNINLYLQNLQRLGIFTYDGGARLTTEGVYQQIEDLYNSEIEQARQFAANSEAETGQKAVLRLSRELLNITPFGHEFIVACLAN